MTRISALLMAAATAIAGVQAGTCPHNGINSFYCGSQLIDVIGCIREADLVRVAPPGAVVRTSIFYVDENGNPSTFALDCSDKGGCANAGPNGVPQSHCFR
ncbi:hypothetical protein QBC42DRAFT_291372 [Cladorrhinum samala]|uniref:Uncharacterized protein n=1 Tax=Cladorrhinum samala TaxID=585594 RepID=A0AAV9HDN5_9PEZI|nr:hypothetical protein QBC42DRAFT_291372 [Cladorrhinum samala]